MQPARKPADLDDSGPDAAGDRRPSKASLICLGIAAAVVFCLLVALGTWQVERRSWKLDLIQRIETRVHAPPVAAPEREEWAGVTAADHEYRHVSVSGNFLNDRETLVTASTELGPGFWVLTPLRLDDGSLVLVNRGFVPPDRRDPVSRQATMVAGETTVTGLLRITEPGGMLLRSNDPAAERWFSRDVEAIAAARGLTDVAPYFIDADAASADAASADAVSEGPGWPVGGLTVIRLHNNHLVYALTWYGLAVMVAVGTGYVIRQTGRGPPEEP
jgi:surfeit locus 1 family protein